MEEEIYKKILHSFHDSICDGIRKKYEGHSGAPVFAAQYRPKRQSDPGSRYGLNGTFLVKIGSQEWAEKEEALYESLSGSAALAPLLTKAHMASDVIDGQTALAYDIAFDSFQTTKLLLDVLHDGRGQSEEETLRQIESLSSTLVQWYLESKHAENYVIEKPHTLLMHMLTKRRAESLLDRLKNMRPSWNADTPLIVIQGSEARENKVLPNPLAYTKEAAWQRIKAEVGCSCLRACIHGDLHTGNIICPPLPQSSAKLIDFDQYDGSGVPFFDLAYLEFDIVRQLLPIEQKKKREHWLTLLDFSMTEKEGDPEVLPWDVRRTWRFIEPIRHTIHQLQDIHKDYRIARWLATVAVGLNFARKGGEERSSFERMAGLLYAAYGLACTLDALDDIFGIEKKTMKEPAFIYWLQGEEDVQSTPDLRLSSMSRENIANTSSHDEDLAIHSEDQQDVTPVRSSNVPDRNALDDPVGKFFEDDVPGLPDAEKINVVSDQRSAAESVPKVAQKSSPLVGGENISIEDAERIQSVLQNRLDYFNEKGLIYDSVCEKINSDLLQLKGYLQEVEERNTALPYPISFPLANARSLEEKVRKALPGFREICPPKGTGKLDPHYDERRDNIARMLKELLAKFQEFLKNYKNLKEYM